MPFGIASFLISLHNNWQVLEDLETCSVVASAIEKWQIFWVIVTHIISYISLFAITITITRLIDISIYDICERIAISHTLPDAI